MSKTGDKKKIGIEIPSKVYKRTKLASVLQDKHFQDIVTEALTTELDRLKIPHPDEMAEENKKT